MEASIITQVFLPLALAIIMMGMGLTLTIQDFKKIVLYPRAIVLGIIFHVILLPLLAWFVIVVVGLKTELAVGLIILASCPAGPTSNLITHLSKGDTALAISLTLCSSLVTVFTIPIVVNLGIKYFMHGGEYQLLPLFRTILTVLFIVAVPVMIGMFLKKKFPAFADKSQKAFKIMSALFLVAIIASALYEERANIGEFFRLAGPASLFLNILTLTVSFILARAISLPFRQSLTISIESGIQNGTLGIAIATTLLHNATMAIPSAIYSIIMFFTAGFIIYIGNKKIDLSIEQ